MRAPHPGTIGRCRKGEGWKSSGGLGSFVPTLWSAGCSASRRPASWGWCDGEKKRHAVAATAWRRVSTTPRGGKSGTCGVAMPGVCLEFEGCGVACPELRQREARERHWRGGPTTPSPPSALLSPWAAPRFGLWRGETPARREDAQGHGEAPYGRKSLRRAPNPAPRKNGIEEIATGKAPIYPSCSATWSTNARSGLGARIGAKPAGSRSLRSGEASRGRGRSGR